MISQIGTSLLYASLFACLTPLIMPYFLSKRDMIKLLPAFALLPFGLLTLAFTLLVYGFIVSDFSLMAVFNYSHTDKPLIYKISGTWGNHEGSILLWCVMLAGFGGFAVIFYNKYKKTLNTKWRWRMMIISHLVNVAFISFLALTSNPFDEILPTPKQGLGLNPLLQDIGLALHPPMLYLGYTSCLVPFIIAILALWRGGSDNANKWLVALHPWIVFGWGVLGAGIALGSWWAYRELGWGGWWFWDPVENASLMPWLAMSALLHAVIAAKIAIKIPEKSSGKLPKELSEELSENISDSSNSVTTYNKIWFGKWLILLAILSFGLCLLGTFLVRSGILTSVHAFANDPARGVYILMIFAVIIGSSLLLYVIRYSNFSSKAIDKVYSREMMIMLQNWLQISLVATVFIGTLYPLFLEMITGEKITVGPPYFQLTFVPITILGLLLIIPALSFRLREPKANIAKIIRNSIIIISLLAISVLIANYKYGDEVNIDIIFMYISVLTGIIIVAYMIYFICKSKLNAKNLAITSGHLGVGLVMIGAGFICGATVSYEQTAKIGEKISLSSKGIFDTQYEFLYHQPQLYQGKNFVSKQAIIYYTKNDNIDIDSLANDQNSHIKMLIPEARIYPNEGQKTSEASINYGLWEVVYVAIGDILPDGTIAIRIYLHPMGLWLWLGFLLISLSSAFSLYNLLWNNNHAKHKK